MNASPSSSGPVKPPAATAVVVPLHWTAEQALAAFDCLHAMRQALWATYGPQVQQAWREQIIPTANRLRSIPTSRSDAAATT